jgi:hypothetical protein
MDQYGTSVPSEYESVPEAPIRRITVADVAHMSYTDPVIIIDAHAIEFHRFPLDPECIVPFILDDFRDELVPVATQGDIHLSEWVNRRPKGYLKDWKVNDSAEKRGIARLFKTPPFFSDWLNDFYLNTHEGQLDFQFLYWGEEGSNTGYHEDVAGTFSWSFNLRGQKEWKFYMHRSDERWIISAIQKPGELVFVPSGCYHTVRNLERDTISINQNWLNEYNLVEVCERILQDSLESKRRFEMFDIKFDTLEEEIHKIDSLVGINNDLNVELILKIIEYRISSGPFQANTGKKINAAITVLRKTPQNAIFEREISCIEQSVEFNR